MGGNVERHIGDDDRDGAAIEALQPGGNGMTHAARDVLAERQRQIEVEGWTPENDDAYQSGDIADAAACYAMTSPRMRGDRSAPFDWPWVGRWWKPTDRRRNLVKAGALILAEIERLDRAALASDGRAMRDAEPTSDDVSFQDRVDPWMQACFGAEISADKLERGDRLLEEVLELLQSGDYPSERIAALTKYVWSREIDATAEEAVTIAMTPDQARAFAAGIVAAADNAEATQ